jgi:glycosyltransferase involved in cell wall biosynthesis
VVRAAARLAAEGVGLRVRLIGHGVEATELQALAEELGAPVEVMPRIPHREVGRQYAWADTVIVSLRSWAPFAWTVPSKLYEVLATGRHVTALLDGEAADIVRAAGAGDVLPPEDVDALVALWRELAADRSRTAVRASGRDWVAEHADDDELARSYLEILREVVEG